MRRKISLFLYILIALPILYAYSQVAETKHWYLNAMNNTCGTEYGCEVCHIDPMGEGSLTRDGINFRESGHDSRYFLAKFNR
jgi:hypothetical protein